MSKTKFSKVLDLVFERTTLLYCKNYSFWKNACPSHLTDEISTELEKELFFSWLTNGVWYHWLFSYTNKNEISRLLERFFKIKTSSISNWIRFCLQAVERSKPQIKELQLSWLHSNERYSKFIGPNTFKL